MRILAVNREGFGEFSNSITFSTNEDGKIFTALLFIIYIPKFYTHTVPSEPRNLTVVASSSTSLQLTWEHPLCEYGVIVNYTVSKIVSEIYLWAKYYTHEYYMHGVLYKIKF